MLTREEYDNLEQMLIQKGYRKWNQDWKRSDFIFWKSFDVTYDEDGEKELGYQVGFAVYDYSKHPNYTHPENKTIAISYNLLLGRKVKFDRIDLEITDLTLTIDEFEQFCNDFYNSEFIKKWKL